MDPINQINPEILDATQGLLSQAEAFIMSLIVPWRLYQLGGIITILVLAWVMRGFVSRRLMAWARAQEGMKKWQLRIIVIFDRNLTLLLFTLLNWMVFWVMQRVTWPSRSQLFEVAASIGIALLIVSVAGRLIGNRFIGRIVTWGASIWVVALILGFDTGVLSFLDSLAVTFGDFRLSALTVIKALIVTGILVTGARLLTRGATNRIRKNPDISPSMQVLAIKGIQLFLFGGAIFIGLKAVGFDLTGLAVLSGAIGVGLGFGLQKVVSNLVSGIIILLDKSIKPGDVISLGDTFGWIESLGARYVSVVTRDGKEYLIPNEDLITGQVVNWSHSDEFVRLDLFFGTAYSDDPHLVRKLAIEAAGRVNRVLKDRPSVCHIVGFGDSSVDYILRFWIKDPTDGLTNIKGNVYLALWDIFKENNISIPFPQREVKLLNDPAESRRAAFGAAEGMGS
ncbi:mechanosensitive ion channel family protein [Pseudorhodobacter sp. E13]|uniref:mechanosensitive ion channel family protein n=1 Tax=Pseudorhodobacter sp. E13 TaxID=2487931 RepID=UPI000F8CA0EB|nr:mechanosensitive ion channel domain-containing protein [Pseudorhodobacter sp. E13]RUS60178.1 mechanosensitive ion channel family protein [Pseudorhodobacter sp. E13]